MEELLGGIRKWALTPEHLREFEAKVCRISGDGQGSRLVHLKTAGGSLKAKEIIFGRNIEKPSEI